MAVVLTEKTGPLFDNVLPGVRKRGGKLKMEEKKKNILENNSCCSSGFTS